MSPHQRPGNPISDKPVPIPPSSARGSLMVGLRRIERKRLTLQRGRKPQRELRAHQKLPTSGDGDGSDTDPTIHYSMPQQDIQPHANARTIKQEYCHQLRPEEQVLTRTYTASIRNHSRDRTILMLPGLQPRNSGTPDSGHAAGFRTKSVTSHLMIHPNEEWFANSIVQASVVVVLVAIILSECGGRFGDESLGSILNVVAAVNDSVVNVAPIQPSLSKQKTSLTTRRDSRVPSLRRNESPSRMSSWKSRV